MTRRFSQSKTPDLEAILRASEVDSRDFQDALAELGFRKTAIARRLKTEFGVTATDHKKLGESLAKKSSKPRPESTSPPVFSDDFETRYEILRRTFTREAEELARWGVTPLLPPDLAIKTLESWKSRLSDTPDAFGRDLKSLATIIARLSRQGE